MEEIRLEQMEPMASVTRVDTPTHVYLLTRFYPRVKKVMTLCDIRTWSALYYEDHNPNRDEDQKRWFAFYEEIGIASESNKYDASEKGEMIRIDLPFSEEDCRRIVGAACGKDSEFRAALDKMHDPNSFSLPPSSPLLKEWLMVN